MILCHYYTCFNNNNNKEKQRKTENLSNSSVFHRTVYSNIYVYLFIYLLLSLLLLFCLFLFIFILVAGSSDPLTFKILAFSEPL